MIDHISVGVSDLERSLRFLSDKYSAAFVIDPDGNRIEAVTFPK
jgi:catechol 2,3-dioxygenase-like lactoylglutathione lyase family enzyme